MAAGRYEEAGEVLIHLIEHSPPPPGMPLSERPSADDARTYMRALAAGDRSRIPEKILRWLTPDDWLRLGEPDTAIGMLPEYLESVSIPGIPGGTALWYPALDPLRDRPDFEALIDQAEIPRRRPLRTPPDERTRPMFLQQHAAGAPGR